MTLTMREISTAIIKGMEKCNYTRRTIQNYAFYLDRFNRQAEASQQPGLYSIEAIEDVLQAQKTRLQNGEISSKYYQRCYRAAFQLKAYAESGQFVRERIPLRSKYALQSILFQTTMVAAVTELKATRHYAPATLEWYENVIRKFCHFLESEGRISFAGLAFRDIIDFVESVRETNKATMDMVIHHLKTFMRFLNLQGMSTVNPEIPILKAIRRQEKNIIYFTKKEVRTLLANFIFDEMGRRDFALLLLAIHTGMRRGDICNLRLQDISWEDYSISIRQNKTGRRIVIPLVPSAGNALADYILHERPKTDDNHVFLIPASPVRPLQGAGADAVVRRRCRKAGLQKPKKCTVHSFRRSLCTWLSQQSESVEEIAQCVGHANIRSVDRYVSYSPSMRDCCLGFKGIEPRGWVEI